MVIIDARPRRLFGSAVMGDGRPSVGLAIDSCRKTTTTVTTMADGIYSPADFSQSFSNSPGIVHRLDNTSAFLPWPPLDEISAGGVDAVQQQPTPSSMFSIFYSGRSPPIKTSQSPSSQTSVASNLPRCPCCRENTAQMLCVVCALQQLRMTRLRESYRAVLRKKAETCQRLGKLLKEQCNNQRDTHEKDASVDALRAKIAAKRASIERVRQRLRNIDVNSVVTRKNNTSLEEKIGKHVKLYAHLDDVQLARYVTVGELECAAGAYIGAFVSQLAAVFAIEPLARPANRKPPIQPTAGGGGTSDAWRNALQNTNARRPAYFSVRGLTINDQCDLKTLYAEEHCRILDHSVKPRSRSLLNTLASSIISAPEIRGCNVKPCRQTLGAFLYIARQLELLALLLDIHLPYTGLYRNWEELCELFHKGAPITRTKSGVGALRSLVFRLDWAIVALGASCGALSARAVEFHSPMYNLLGVLQALTSKRPSPSPSPPAAIGLTRPRENNKQQGTTSPRLQFLRPTPVNFSAQLNTKIIEDFQKIHWEENGGHDFSVDNVEEDWVNIGLNLK